MVFLSPEESATTPSKRLPSTDQEQPLNRRPKTPFLLSESTLEVLQVLKQPAGFVFRLLAKEDDYAIDHATEAAIHKLMSAGNSEGLT